MRITEIGSRSLSNIERQVKSLQTNRSANKPAASVTQISKSDGDPQDDHQFYYNGEPLISSRGLPYGWINDAGEFIQLTHNEKRDSKLLRLVLIKRRYDKPLFE
jgi:hypothetical protein